MIILLTEMFLGTLGVKCLWGRLFLKCMTAFSPPKTLQNVYIYGTILTPKTSNCLACGGCVKNVYIWHHFDPTPKKNKIILVCSRMCKKYSVLSKNFVCGGHNSRQHRYHKTYITSRKITFSNQTTKCVNMASFRGKKIKN